MSGSGLPPNPNPNPVSAHATMPNASQYDVSSAPGTYVTAGSAFFQRLPGFNPLLYTNSNLARLNQAGSASTSYVAGAPRVSPNLNMIQFESAATGFGVPSVNEFASYQPQRPVFHNTQAAGQIPHQFRSTVPSPQPRPGMNGFFNRNEYPMQVGFAFSPSPNIATQQQSQQHPTQIPFNPLFPPTYNPMTAMMAQMMMAAQMGMMYQGAGSSMQPSYFPQQPYMQQYAQLPSAHQPQLQQFAHQFEQQQHYSPSASSDTYYSPQPTPPVQHPQLSSFIRDNQQQFSPAIATPPSNILPPATLSHQQPAPLFQQPVGSLVPPTSHSQQQLPPTSAAPSNALPPTPQSQQPRRNVASAPPSATSTQQQNSDPMPPPPITPAVTAVVTSSTGFGFGFFSDAQPNVSTAAQIAVSSTAVSSISISGAATTASQVSAVTNDSSASQGTSFSVVTSGAEKLNVVQLNEVKKTLNPPTDLKSDDELVAQKSEQTIEEKPQQDSLPALASSSDLEEPASVEEYEEKMRRRLGNDHLYYLYYAPRTHLAGRPFSAKDDEDVDADDDADDEEETTSSDDKAEDASSDGLLEADHVEESNGAENNETDEKSDKNATQTDNQADFVPVVSESTHKSMPIIPPAIVANANEKLKPIEQQAAVSMSIASTLESIEPQSSSPSTLPPKKRMRNNGSPNSQFLTAATNSATLFTTMSKQSPAKSSTKQPSTKQQPPVAKSATVVTPLLAPGALAGSSILLPTADSANLVSSTENVDVERIEQVDESVVDTSLAAEAVVRACHRFAGATGDTSMQAVAKSVASSQASSTSPTDEELRKATSPGMPPNSSDQTAASVTDSSLAPNPSVLRYWPRGVFPNIKWEQAKKPIDKLHASSTVRNYANNNAQRLFSMTSEQAKAEFHRGFTAEAMEILKVEIREGKISCSASKNAQSNDTPAEQQTPTNDCAEVSHRARRTCANYGTNKSIPSSKASSSNADYQFDTVDESDTPEPTSRIKYYLPLASGEKTEWVQFDHASVDLSKIDKAVMSDFIAFAKLRTCMTLDQTALFYTKMGVSQYDLNDYLAEIARSQNPQLQNAELERDQIMEAIDRGIVIRTNSFDRRAFLERKQTNTTGAPTSSTSKPVASTDTRTKTSADDFCNLPKNFFPLPEIVFKGDHYRSISAPLFYQRIKELNDLQLEELKQVQIKHLKERLNQCMRRDYPFSSPYYYAGDRQDLRRFLDDPIDSPIPKPDPTTTAFPLAASLPGFMHHYSFYGKDGRGARLRSKMRGWRLDASTKGYADEVKVIEEATKLGAGYYRFKAEHLRQIRAHKSNNIATFKIREFLTTEDPFADAPEPIYQKLKKSKANISANRYAYTLERVPSDTVGVPTMEQCPRFVSEITQALLAGRKMDVFSKNPAKIQLSQAFNELLLKIHRCEPIDLDMLLDIYWEYIDDNYQNLVFVSYPDIPASATDRMQRVCAFDENNDYSCLHGMAVDSDGIVHSTSRISFMPGSPTAVGYNDLMLPAFEMAYFGVQLIMTVAAERSAEVEPIENLMFAEDAERCSLHIEHRDKFYDFRILAERGIPIGVHILRPGDCATFLEECRRFSINLSSACLSSSWSYGSVVWQYVIGRAYAKKALAWKKQQHDKDQTLCSDEGHKGYAAIDDADNYGEDLGQKPMVLFAPKKNTQPYGASFQGIPIHPDSADYACGYFPFFRDENHTHRNCEKKYGYYTEADGYRRDMALRALNQSATTSKRNHESGDESAAEEGASLSSSSTGKPPRKLAKKDQSKEDCVDGTPMEVDMPPVNIADRSVKAESEQEGVSAVVFLEENGYDGAAAELDELREGDA